MRLFIAIPLASDVTRLLAGLRSRLERPGDGLRWSNPESWHVTLQFLGATSESQYACLMSNLCGLLAPAISIRMEGLGFFDRAGVFFAGVRITPELVALQQSVTATTSQCGFVPEDRPYHPHITLARNQGRSRGIPALKPKVEALAEATPQFSPFTAREFVLYESFLGPTGSRYEVRARFPFAASQVTGD
jgi:2'-5' RNA ligase